MTAAIAPVAVPQPVAAEHAPAALYEGTVGHHRSGPTPRTFTPKLFLAYLDVDALPGSLDRLPLWSARRAAPVHFRREDFFDGGTQPLADAVRDLVEARLGRRPAGSVFLLAHLRTFGWLANPLAVYYCWAADGHALEAIVLEVTNTPWGERQWYVFDARDGKTSATTPKAMHVSPFLPMDLEYRVTWTDPRAALRLRIQVTRGGTPVFEADLALRRTTLDRRSAIGVLARRPMMPFRVSAGIYRQALNLFVRRTPPVSSSAPTPTNGATMSPTHRNVTESLGRRVFARLLGRIVGGTIELIDPSGTEWFGDPHPAVAADPIHVRVTVHDARLYPRLLREGSVGLGESYADGWWDTDDLAGFLRLAHRNLSRTHAVRDRFHRAVSPSSTRSPADGPQTRNVTRRTSGPTTTWATSCSSACSTTR